MEIKFEVTFDVRSNVTQINTVYLFKLYFKSLFAHRVFERKRSWHITKMNNHYFFVVVGFIIQK